MGMLGCVVRDIGDIGWYLDWEGGRIVEGCGDEIWILYVSIIITVILTTLYTKYHL